MESDRAGEEPDHTEDPREQGTASSGYPESNPEEATPREGTQTGPQGGTDDVDAPSPSTEEEANRDQSTGNPDAAG